MKAILLAILLPVAAFAAVKQATITGRLFIDRGPASQFFDTTFPTPFTASWQFDTDAMDENPDPQIGEYESEGLPVTLDFGNYHFESTGTKVTVSSVNFNWGFILWNDTAFSQNGFDIPEYGLFIQFNNYLPVVSPDDGIDSVVEYDITHESSTERMYVINEDWYAVPKGPNAVRLLSDATSGIDTFTVTDVVPEPSCGLLLAFGFLVLMQRFRSQGRLNVP